MNVLGITPESVVDVNENLGGVGVDSRAEACHGMSHPTHVLDDDGGHQPQLVIEAAQNMQSVYLWHPMRVSWSPFLVSPAPKASPKHVHCPSPELI